MCDISIGPPQANSVPHLRMSLRILIYSRLSLLLHPDRNVGATVSADTLSLVPAGINIFEEAFKYVAHAYVLISGLDSMLTQFAANSASNVQKELSDPVRRSELMQASVPHTKTRTKRVRTGKAVGLSPSLTLFPEISKH